MVEIWIFEKLSWQCMENSLKGGLRPVCVSVRSIAEAVGRMPKDSLRVALKTGPDPYRSGLGWHRRGSVTSLPGGLCLNSAFYLCCRPFCVSCPLLTGGLLKAESQGFHLCAPLSLQLRPLTVWRQYYKHVCDNNEVTPGGQAAACKSQEGGSICCSVGVMPGT